jgi:tRNA dimethylallyltransferase
LLYFLTGITASGKSNLAHKIAIENNMSILSVDSMAVYRGLDIVNSKTN